MATKLKVTLKPSPEFNDDSFYSSIDECQTIAERTKKNYFDRLRDIQAHFWTEERSLYWILQHPIEFREALIRWGDSKKGRDGHTTLSLSTLMTYYGTVVALFTHHPSINIKFPSLSQFLSVSPDTPRMDAVLDMESNLSIFLYKLQK